MSKQNIPATGFKGLRENWRSDLIAGLSVSLVALPISLGIAQASGAEPIAGVISSIIGGLLTTFYRGSKVGINGPGNGLIAVVFLAIVQLTDDPSNPFLGYKYALAAFIIAGGIQVLLGVLKLGKFADLFPSSVIHGKLAAIGVIILAKQLYTAFNIEPTEGQGPLELVLNLPDHILGLNPFITSISFISLLVLIFHSKIRNKFIHFIPAPMWVLIFSVPLAYFFLYSQNENFDIIGASYAFNESILVNIPDNIFNGFMRPDFSKIGEFDFWLVVLSLLLVASIETLLISKAIEKLDPYRRVGNPNKELVGVGLSTVLAGCIGALPIITVIIRSSVNVNHGAKTKWSNFFHGLALLIFILVLSPAIEMIPMAALATILVFTGFRLASPRVFKETYRKGIEQLWIFIVTFAAVLILNDLVYGIMVGVLFTAILHYSKSKVPLRSFINYVLKPKIKLISEKNQKHVLKVKGISNFLTILKLKKTLESVPKKERVILDFSHTRLVDHTVLEYVHDFAEEYKLGGGEFDILGLEIHQVSSNHPDALHVLKPISPIVRLTKRQAELKQLASYKGWTYQPQMDWNTFKFKNFDFFEVRTIEHKHNSISNEEKDLNLNWEISDITFLEGTIIEEGIYHTTAEVIDLPFEIPKFTLEKEDMFDAILDLAQHEDIKIKDDKFFTKNYLLKGENKEAIKKLFCKELRLFFKENNFYHVESNGNSLLVFRHLRLASPNEVARLHSFSLSLVDCLKDLPVLNEIKN